MRRASRGMMPPDHHICVMERGAQPGGRSPARPPTRAAAAGWQRRAPQPSRGRKASQLSGASRRSLVPFNPSPGVFDLAAQGRPRSVNGLFLGARRSDRILASVQRALSGTAASFAFGRRQGFDASATPLLAPPAQAGPATAALTSPGLPGGPGRRGREPEPRRHFPPPNLKDSFTAQRVATPGSTALSVRMRTPPRLFRNQIRCDPPSTRRRRIRPDSHYARKAETARVRYLHLSTLKRDRINLSVGAPRAFKADALSSQCSRLTF